MQYSVGLITQNVRPTRYLLTGSNPPGNPVPGSPAPKPGPVVPGQQRVLVNPSPAEMRALMESTGRRLIGVEVGGQTFVTSEVAGSSHTKLLERVGSSTAVDHTRTVIGVDSTGKIEKVSVPVSGRTPKATPPSAKPEAKVESPKPQQAFPKKGHMEGRSLPGKPGAIKNAIEAIFGKDKKGPLKRILKGIVIEQIVEKVLDHINEVREGQKIAEGKGELSEGAKQTLAHLKSADESMIGILEWTDP
jgi:hypothetical protein